MLVIKNLKQARHTFTLSDGSTLRLFPGETTTIEDNLVSEDLRRAEKQGLIHTEVKSPAPERAPTPVKAPKLVPVKPKTEVLKDE